MKKFLVFIIAIYISTFSIAHGYEHANMNEHIHKVHSTNLNNHAHFENTHRSVDTHDQHHPSFHKHIDDLFLRSARQRKPKNSVLFSNALIHQNTFLDTFSLRVFKNFEAYCNPTYCNFPFKSRNRPLLI